MDLDCIKFHQYGGLWGLSESHVDLVRDEFQLQCDAFRGMSHDQLGTLLAARTEKMKSEANAGYTVDSNGIARVSISGTMTKNGSSLSTAGSMKRAELAVSQAARDESVKGLIAVIDSPGGSIHGLTPLADAFRAFGQSKPSTAFIEGLGASAAYWFASQANTVVAEPGSSVGSIGVYQAIADYSAQAIQDGVKIHVVRFGAFKGAGVPGTEVTAQQLAEWQRQCEECGQAFVKAFTATRGMSLEAGLKLADGRVHSAEAAQALRLIDQVATYDQAYADLVAKVSPAPSPKKGSKMSAATYQEIVGACKHCQPQTSGDDARFVADCQAKGLELSGCVTAWMDTLNARNEIREKEAADARTAAAAAEEKASKAVQGQGPIRKQTSVQGDASDGTATERWRALTANLPSGEAREAAMSRLVQQNQKLHADYLAEFNAAHPHRETNE